MLNSTSAVVKKLIIGVKKQINTHHIPCYPCKYSHSKWKVTLSMTKQKTSAPFVLVVFIGQNTCLWFVCFFTQQHENLSTSITTISTKCVFYKRIIFQTVFWDSVLGYSSADILALVMRRLVVYTPTTSKPKVNAN